MLLLFIGILLIVSWSQCPHCSRLPQIKLLNKNLKIIIKKFIEEILEKMHFFCRKVHFSVEWTRQSRYCLEFSDECLEVDGVFLTQVLHHFRWEKLGGGADAVRL